MKAFLPAILLLASIVTPFAQQIDEPYRVSTLVLTGSGDAIGAHAFFDALDLAVNTAGEIFIAERSSSDIRKIAVNGAVSTFAGYYGASGFIDGLGTNARFDFPSSLAVDAAGTIYVTDTNNHLIRKISPDRMVSTLAGGPGGRDGFGNADGVGRQARFKYPVGIAVDLNGFIYVGDQDNTTVRKITPDAVVSTLAGLAGSRGFIDGQGSAARFNSVSAITTDGPGNIYVTDTSCVRKISPDGYVTTLAGVGNVGGYIDGPGANARFAGVTGITTGPSGDLFVDDSGNGRIRKITPAGTVTTLAGGYPMQYLLDLGPLDGTGNQARFYDSKGITADSNGLLYVAEGRVRTVTPSGVVTTHVAGSLFHWSYVSLDDAGEIPPLRPSDISIDPHGNIYVAEVDYFAIRKISPDRIITTLLPTYLRSDGRRVPVSVSADALVVDGDANIFFGNGSCVRKISPAGEVTVFAGDPIYTGTADGVGSAARFAQIGRLILDDHKNLYACDVDNCTIRKITPEGVVTTVAGSARNCGNNDGIGTAAKFAWPLGLARDSGGNIYVADSHQNVVGNTIRKISPDGVVTTIAGSPGTYGYMDGVGTLARFDTPTAVALDRTGNIFVTDSVNGRLRKVSPAGFVTTLAGGGSSSFPPTDGVGAAASFGSLRGITSDSVANRYIADGSGIRVATSTLKSHALNVSTRLQVLQGENVLIGGFIIGGTSSKNVIVRALGPSLAAYEVNGALPDPVLELYDSSGHLIASNDSWKVNAQTGMSQQAAVEATTLAPANDLEAALIATLDPEQAYTAVVRGSHGETGVSIVELFDLNSSSPASLANISTRGFVESGDKVMIGGFILGGNNGSGEVVVRALGPSLAQSGIANPLGNPSLELFDGNGQRIASNDDWEEPNGAIIRATGLQPASNLESAILASLPAGAYTAVVQGHNESGVGLVEVYNLP